MGGWGLLGLAELVALLSDSCFECKDRGLLFGVALGIGKGHIIALGAVSFSALFVSIAIIVQTAVTASVATRIFL